ncbi:hypothetical protein EfmGK923_20290 [Enterococcus faecium]|nr:hypothetical protein EfmGK923_20290 [Enterococcus faecium]
MNGEKQKTKLQISTYLHIVRELEDQDKEKINTVFDSLYKNKNPHNFVFFNLKNGLVSSNAVSKYLRKKLKELGIEKQFTLHGLRHTHASILLYQGVNILSVSKRLGHSSLETTMSTYLHIVRELEDQDKEKINTVFDSLYKNDN